MDVVKDFERSVHACTFHCTTVIADDLLIKLEVCLFEKFSIFVSRYVEKSYYLIIYLNALIGCAASGRKVFGRFMHR